MEGKTKPVKHKIVIMFFSTVNHQRVETHFIKPSDTKPIYQRYQGVIE
jgi:hypothetical protein